MVMSDHPNILLVILDSVRAKNTSLHNYKNKTTPFLNDFADNATQYKQARAPSIHSVASHASIWSGRHVEEHGCIEHSSKLEPKETVWNDLSSNGYETGLFTPNTIVGEASNLSEPFDYVDVPKAISSRPFSDAIAPLDLDGQPSITKFVKAAIEAGQPIRGIINGVYAFNRSRKPRPTAPAQQYGSSFLDWQAKCEDSWAACLNFMDPHLPYLPDEEFDIWAGEKLRKLHKSIPPGPFAEKFPAKRPWWELEALTSLYDGGIRQADAEVRRIITELKARNEYEDTLIVITSDHGEGFGETSILRPELRMVDHSWGINEVLVHVPLVVKYPGQTEKSVINKPASLTNFRQVVKGVKNGKRSGFEDGQVLTTTFRLKPENIDSIGAPDFAELAVGPWRAAYHLEDGLVTKYAAVGRSNRSTATVKIPNAHVSFCEKRDDGNQVESDFKDVTIDEGLKKTNGQIENPVKDRLKELGYM